MISCKDAIDRLWVYLDQHIHEAQSAELEEHLGLCLHCCGELKFARRVRTLLRRSSADHELKPELRERLETFLNGLSEDSQ